MTAAPSRLHDWLDLGRAANLPSVWSNTLAALVLASTSWPAGAHWLAATALGSAMYVGGAMLNDVADADFDRRHRPDRAIPAGRVPRTTAGLVAGGALGAAAIGLVAIGASPAWALVTVAAIVSYDWLHKRWAGSVVLMALCRAALGLTVASTVVWPLPPAVWWWVLALSSYIVVLSLVARNEYRLPHRELPLRALVGRLLALMPVIDALALAAVGAWTAAVSCLLAVPLGRVAQRVFAAT